MDTRPWVWYIEEMAGENELTLENHSEDGVLTVDVIGRATTIAASGFQSQLDEFVLGKEKVIFLNCEKMEFISSSGLRVILRLAKDISGRDKKLCIFALNSNVAHVFEISGFNKIVDLYDDRAQALASL